MHINRGANKTRIERITYNLKWWLWWCAGSQTQINKQNKHFVAFMLFGSLPTSINFNRKFIHRDISTMYNMWREGAHTQNVCNCKHFYQSQSRNETIFDCVFRFERLSVWKKNMFDKKRANNTYCLAQILRERNVNRKTETKSIELNLYRLTGINTTKQK